MARIPIQKKRQQRQIKREYVMNAAKGLNTLVSESLIDKREASSLLNIQFDESGVIKKRNGFGSIGTSLSNAQCLTYFYTETNKELITVNAGQPQRFSSGVWSDITGVTMDASRPYIDATQARGFTYLWDGVSGGVQYDGSTTTRPGTIPKGKFSIYNNGLHIVSGVPGQASRVYFSAGGKPAVFTRDGTGKPAGTAAGDGWPDNATDVPGATIFTGTAPAFTIDVGKDDGFAVTGLAIFQGDIVIFKENAIYQLTFDGSTTDNTSAKLTVVTKSVGCVSHRTIAYVENDVYFLSRRGVYVLGNEENFYTAIRTNELSARVRPTMNAISPAGYDKCNAVYYADQYLLAAPVGSTSINRIVGYDRRYQAWTLWDKVAPRDMMPFIDNTNTEHFYFIQDAPNSAVKEMQPGRYNDDGEAISAFWESGALDAQSIDITKRYVDLGLVLRQLSGVLNITIIGDGQEVFKETSISGDVVSTGYGSAMVGDEWIGGNILSMANTLSVTNDPWRIVVKRNSRTIKFRVENSRNNETFALLGYILGYYPFSYFKYNSARKVF